MNLAELEEQRQFLLGSLDDLQAEHEAGDIDDVDYEELKADYTLRLADTQRSLEAKKNLVPTKPPASKGKAAAWVMGLAVLGLVAGILVAQSSGNRLAGESSSGDALTSVVTRLNQARAVFGDQERWGDAYELYDSVLEEQPGNVEALTYNAWLRFRSGDWIDESISAWEEVTRIDPTYSDALVFRTIALTDIGRYQEAQQVLELFDASVPAPELMQLVEAQGLRFRLLAELRQDQLTQEQAVTLEQLEVTTEQALGMAGFYLFEGYADANVLALKLYDAVLQAEPTNPRALSRSAFIFQQAGLLENALERTDLAVAENPDNPEALLTRAEIYAGSGDATVACDMLDALDALGEVPEQIETRAALARNATCT